MGSISVSDALSTLSLGQDLITYLISKRNDWEFFGKMNSHIYRQILMKHMDESNLRGEERLMVFFFFSVIKNRDRILKAMDNMEDSDKSRSWFAPVRTFISAKVTQYVSDVTRSRKFPGVNIPNCNPGLDILFYCMITHPNNRSVVEASHRPTFSQLDLDDDAQMLALEGYMYYWNNIVQGSKNPDAVPNQLPTPQFRQEYYNNSAGDRYKLIDLNLNEIAPRNPNTGYSLVEITEYFDSIDFVGELDRNDSETSRERERLNQTNNAVTTEEVTANLTT